MSYVPLVPGTPYQESSRFKFEQQQAEKQRGFRLAPGAIWAIAIVIVVIAAIITIYLILQQEREVLEVPYADEILNLDGLIDLTDDGECCVPPAVATPTTRWVYLPSTDFTYSSDPLDPEIV